MTDDLLAGVEAAAGFAVRGVPATASRRELVHRGIPGLLAGKDPTLWGPAAEAGARSRLEFLDGYRAARELLPLIAELHEELGDLRTVVLAGPGPAAEAVARTLGRPLTVLDEPDPHAVRALIDDPEALRRTVVVLVDESLGSVFWQAYRDLGLTAAEAGRHFVVLCGPLPALEDAGAVAVPTGAGALGAGTLLPAAFAGVDVADLLDEAELFAPSLATDDDNPALALGLALAGADRITLVPDGSGLELGEWAAGLLTDGLGVPVVLAGSPLETGSADGLTVTYGGSMAPGGAAAPVVAVNGPLGAHLLAWPYAVALAAHVRGVDPFRTSPAGTAVDEPGAPSFVEDAVEIFTTDPATDLTAALRELLAGVDDQLTVRAFLDRGADAGLARLRPLLAAASGRPVSFGWGQYPRGGSRRGSFLQITGSVTGDVPVPGQQGTLGGRQATRAAADRHTFALSGRPLLRLHLTDRTRGARQVIAAAEMLRH